MQHILKKIFVIVELCFEDRQYTYKLTAIDDESYLQITTQEFYWRQKMNADNSKEEKQTESPSQEGLIKREWDIINELQKMLKDPELTVMEKTRVASVLAFHTP